MLDEKIDDPVRFTLNAYSLFRARGRHTDAAIAIKPLQEAYMRLAFEGCSRTDDVIPSKSARLNKHGNMTRRYTQRIVNQKKGFWKTAKSGVRTLFIRNDVGGIEAVAFKPKRVEWEPFIAPFDEAKALVDAIQPEEAEKAFEKAFSKD